MVGPVSDSSKQKFTGNVSLYRYLAQYRQRCFLHRNIDAVLERNERRAQGSSRSASSAALPEIEASRVSHPPRSRPSIDQILNKLSSGGLVEAQGAVFHIEARSLRKKQASKAPINVHGNSNGASSRSPPPVRGSGTSIRCRCELTIYERIDKSKSTGKSVPRTKGRDGVDRNQLYRSNVLCTITYESNEVASIEMDDGFFIKARSLHVLINGHDNRTFGLAESYIVQFALQPTDINSPWPPLLSREFSRSIQKWGDVFSVHLVTSFNCLPGIPRDRFHDLSVKVGSVKGEKPDLVLELDCKWIYSKPPSANIPAQPQVPRLSTPSVEIRGNSKGGTTVTSYVFIGPADDKEQNIYSGPSDISNRQIFPVMGFICPFGDAPEFKTCKALHFHLITNHDHLQYTVKQQSTLPFQDVVHDNVVEIMINLSREVTMNRASDHVPDHRTFRWVKPKTKFDLNKIFAGDWSWLNEKRGFQTAIRKDSGEACVIPAQAPVEYKKISLAQIKDIPPRIKRKYKVPPSKNGVKGLVFIRSQSKRFARPGEELSESDDDVDEDWLRMKHDDTVQDFEDVARNEQTMMKLWDQHLFKERPIAYIHVSPTLIRFAREHAEFLRNSVLLLEFYKHCLNLVQYGIVNPQCVWICMDIIKGGEWSSEETSKWGVGLVGPSPLDNIPAESKRKGKERADNFDAMDMDQRPEDEVRSEKDLSVVTARDSGICMCGMPWRRPEMVRCEGIVSTTSLRSPKIHAHLLHGISACFFATPKQIDIKRRTC
ncbi:hypothetical protein RUND412_004073 [Rhizina undulata]